MKTSKINVNSAGMTTKSNRLKDSLPEVLRQFIKVI